MNEPSTNPASRLHVWLRRLVWLGAAWFILAVVYIIARRFTYPFELEWLEGGTMIQVLRLLQGQPLYAPPDLSYIAFVYPPLYYYVSATIALGTGIHWFTSLRLVSMAATLGAAILIYRIVRHQSGAVFWGWISVGLFAATFRLGGAWFDTARVDMLFIFLFIWGTYALVHGGRFANVFAGILFAMAFYTKQTALVPVLAVTGWLILRRNWRAARELAGVFLLLSLTLILIENYASNGWYQYYVFDIPGRYRLPSPAWLALLGAGSGLLGALAVAFVISFMPAVVAPSDFLRGNGGTLGVITLSAIAISVVGDAHVGGYDNAKLPALATLAIMAGLGGAWLESRAPTHNRPLFLSLLYGLLVVQFGLLYYSISAQIPSQTDRRAGEAVVNAIAATPGEVLVPYHSYLAVMAGKQPSAHQVMLWDLHGNFGEMDRQNWPKLEKMIRVSLSEQHFSRILLDREDEVWQDVPRFYVGRSVSYPGPQDFYPVTGGRARPNIDFLPR